MRAYQRARVMPCVHKAHAHIRESLSASHFFFLYFSPTPFTPSFSVSSSALIPRPSLVSSLCFYSRPCSTRMSGCVSARSNSSHASPAALDVNSLPRICLAGCHAIGRHERARIRSILYAGRRYSMRADRSHKSRSSSNFCEGLCPDGRHI